MTENTTASLPLFGYSKNDGQPKEQSKARRLAEIYHVSPRTIERDAQVAVAIDAIGERSTEAKREILTGTTGITRKKLQVLSAGSVDEVAEVAAMIEVGSFKSHRAAIISGAADGRETETSPVTAGTGLLESTVSRITNDLHSELREFSSNGDIEAFKTALRSSIGALEDLYRQLLIT